MGLEAAACDDDDDDGNDDGDDDDAFEVMRDATSAGLGFRSFSPILSQSVPNASSSVFLKEDDVPPSNQRGSAARGFRVCDFAGATEGTTATGGGITAVRIADGDSIFPATHVATILLVATIPAFSIPSGVGSVATRK